MKEMNSCFCLKCNKNFVTADIAEDFCVDCDFFDSGECWVADLPVKYVDDEPIYLIQSKEDEARLKWKGNKNG